MLVTFCAGNKNVNRVVRDGWSDINAASGNRLDRLKQLRRSTLLEDVTKRSPPHCFFRCLWILIHREENDFAVWHSLPELLASFESVQVRHVNVRDDDVRKEPLCARNKLPSIG